jgi:hypothetical protein
LTAAELRRFGLTLGAAFAVIAAIIYWRRGATPFAMGAGGLGLGLASAALLAPGALAPVERAWMGLAHALSRVTTPIILAIIYFLIITPIGLLRRATGRNALVRRLGDAELAEGGYWVVRPAGRTRSDLSRQF